MNRPRNRIAAALALAAVMAAVGCDEDDGGGGDGESGDGNACEVYGFEYEGEPEDGLCPRIECCPGDGDGTFSAVDNGRCLSAANCEAVCENTDEAFECL